MQVQVLESQVSGSVQVPSSKSFTNRGVVCAALAKGTSQVVYPLICDDTLATFENVMRLGAQGHRRPEVWEITGRGLTPPGDELYCRQSGTTARFLTGVAALVPGPCKITGGASLSRRPFGPLLAGLEQLGVSCTSREGRLPIVVHGGGIRGGTVKVEGHIDSQFISALLLISPLAAREVSIVVTTPPVEKPYLIMTLEAMRDFGVRVEADSSLREFRVTPQRYIPTTYNVEGDWSSAAFLLATGLVAGRVECTNLNLASAQADRRIFEILLEMGADLQATPSSVTANESRLCGIKVDVSDCPDLFPILAVLAATAEGESELHGVRGTRTKESDRVSAMSENLRRLGVWVDEEDDRVRIRGRRPLSGVVDSKQDHRVAMAFGVLGMAAGNEITVTCAECVSKSFPSFWETAGKLGARLKTTEREEGGHEGVRNA